MISPKHYALLFLLLIVSRGMDLLSTWVATPNLVLESNPLAKTLGWKWSIPFSFVPCFVLALWSLPAIMVGTASVLVAARNFHNAWLTRSMGEHRYFAWYTQQAREAPVTTFLWCLFGETVLTASVGVAIIYFSNPPLVLVGIGAGIVVYAIAVAFYSLLAAWRLRRPISVHPRSSAVASDGLRVRATD